MECELHIAKTSGLLVELGGTMKNVIFLLMAALCFATVSSADEIHLAATCNANADFSHCSFIDHAIRRRAVLDNIFQLVDKKQQLLTEEVVRSEERGVGQYSRSRWSPHQ